MIEGNKYTERGGLDLPALLFELFSIEKNRVLFYIDEKLMDEDFTFNCFKNLLVEFLYVTTRVPKYGSGGNCSGEIFTGKCC